MNDQMLQLIVLLVLAAMQGDQQATQLILQIMQAAKQGDQLAGALAQMILLVAQQMQGALALSAKRGAKLNYLKSLQNKCAEDEELSYFKVGGKVCTKCMKKAAKAACGTKVLKNEKGGVSKVANSIKSELKKNNKIEPTDTIHTSSKDKGYKPGTPLALTKKAEKAGYAPYPKQGKGLHQSTRQRAHIKDAEAGRE